MLHQRAARRPLFLVSIITVAALAACGGGGGDGPTTEAPAVAAATGLKLENPASQVALVAAPVAAADPSLVVMRDVASGAMGPQVFELADGSRVTVQTDAQGRLTEVNASGHRFVFSDYTATAVTVTHTSATGVVTTESWSLVNGSVQTAQKADLSTARKDAVDETLSWVSNVGNTHLIANMYQKLGEAAAEKLKKVVEFAKKVAGTVGTMPVVRNVVGCQDLSAVDCGEKLAEKGPQFVRELPAMNPSSSTTAGIDVKSSGVVPRRSEWYQVTTPTKVQQGFTMTEVPCAESVFADMNPSCPQYVPPTTGSTTGGSTTGGSTTGGSTTGGSTTGGSTTGGSTTGGSTTGGSTTGGSTTGGSTTGGSTTGGSTTGGSTTGGSTTGGSTTGGSTTGTQTVRRVGSDYCVPTIPGVNMAGKYVAPEPDRHPFTLLNADGTGVQEVYGAPKTEYVFQIKWCVRSDSAGRPIKTQETANGAAYVLILEMQDKPYQGQWVDYVSYYALVSGPNQVLDRKKE